MKTWRWIPIVALAGSLQGCMGLKGPEHMGLIPLAEGPVASYRASLPEVEAAAGVALSERNLEVVDATRSDSAAIVIGKRGAAFGNGHFVRLSAFERGDVVEVRAAHLDQKGGSFLAGAGRSALATLLAFDRAVGADRISLHAGMHVRGTTPDGSRVAGPLVPRPQGGFGVGEGGYALTSLERPEVKRGDYGRATEGRLVGLIVGYVAATLLLPRDDTGQSIGEASAGGLRVVLNGVIGGAVGALLGGVVGDGIRTDVWSPLGGR